jgi:hypothetical protein
MAKKPAATPPLDDIQELPPAMDYAQHQATWNGVTSMVKWSIITLAVVCVALYFFIEGHQPIIGAVLLLLLPIVGVAMAVMRSRTPS